MGSSRSPRYRVVGLNPNTNYQFTVKAWDADGNSSAASEPLAVTTPLPPDQVYLSQLNWTSASSGFGSVGKDRSVTGGRIRLKNTIYERGIGTHATSKIVYDLQGLGRTYARFVSDVGIDGDQKGSVVFQVFADGKKVFDSRLMTAASPPQTIDISVAGVKQLTLLVTDGGDGINSDHADWAGAAGRPADRKAVGLLFLQGPSILARAVCFDGCRRFTLIRGLFSRAQEVRNVS